MKGSTTKNNLSKIIGISLWFAIWQIGAMTVDNIYILPSPLLTFKTLFELRHSKEFLLQISTTLNRVLIGFVSSVVLGSIFGLASGLNRWVHDFFKPFVVVVRSTPVISVIIIILLFVETDMVPVGIAFLMGFPIMWQNAYEGLLQTDKKKLEMAKCFKVGRINILKGIYLPSIKPYIITGIITTLGISWKVTVAAEVMSFPKLAIGSRLMESKLYVDTAEVFAWTIIVVLLSFIFEFIIKTQLMKLNKGDQHD